MASSSSSHRGSAIAVDRLAADSPSDFSDTSSVDSMSVGGRGEHSSSFAAQQQQQRPPSPATRDQFMKRVDSLQQENRVLKIEVETFKLKVKALQDENKHLRQTSCELQARAEAEEEYISNTLMKKISTLKKEKEKLACSYEQEEECLTNQLSRKLNKLRQEKVELEQSLEKEQEVLVSRLMKRIHKLENDVRSKQQTLDQLRREKVELENSLEQEQEALVNKLWVRMHKLEEEKRHLQEQLQLPASAPQSPCASTSLPGASGAGASSSSQAAQVRGSSGAGSSSTGSTSSLAATNQAHSTAAAIMDNENKRHIELLRAEVARLKRKLSRAEKDHVSTMGSMSTEEKQLREENLRLHRKLQLEFNKQKTFACVAAGGSSVVGSGVGMVSMAGVGGLAASSDSGAAASSGDAGGGGAGGGGSMSMSESEHSLDTDQYGDSLGGEDLYNISGPPSNHNSSGNAPASVHGSTFSTNPNLRRQRGRTDSETSFGGAGDRAGNSSTGGGGAGNVGAFSGVNNNVPPVSPAYSVQASPRSVFHAPSPVYVGNTSSSSSNTQQSSSSAAAFLLGIHSSFGGGAGGASTPGTHPPPSPMDTASIRSCESPLAMLSAGDFPAAPEPLSSSSQSSYHGSNSMAGGGGGVSSSGSVVGGKRQFAGGSGAFVAKSGRQTPTPSPSSSSVPSPMASGAAGISQQQQQQLNLLPSSAQSSSMPSTPHSQH